jgi:hypothetical protein
MNTSSARKHAGPGRANDQSLVPEPSFAERARTLAYLGRVGSLSTLSRKQAGFPFGSVMPYGLDSHGCPLFLISTMAMHTQNLQADHRASLLVTQDDGAPRLRKKSMHRLWAIRNIQGERERLSSNWSSFRYASKSASCTTSSPSRTEPVIRAQYR